MSFLYSMTFLVIYVLFKHKYDNIVFLPIIVSDSSATLPNTNMNREVIRVNFLKDFFCTALFTLFWFCGSIAWAKAITDIKNYTDPGTLIGELPVACSNPDKNCQVNLRNTVIVYNDLLNLIWLILACPLSHVRQHHHFMHHWLRKHNSVGW